jgi:hypothetical protein
MPILTGGTKSTENLKRTEELVLETQEFRVLQPFVLFLIYLGTGDSERKQALIGLDWYSTVSHLSQGKPVEGARIVTDVE